MLRRIFYIMLVISVLSWVPLLPAAQKPSEYQVKAAYLYNFAKFITWPTDAFSDKKTPFIIGVLGKSEFRDYLIPLSSKTVHNRSIVIKYFKTLEELTNCHILFFSSSESNQLQSQLKKIATKPIVTISDKGNFAQKGGMIQFIPVRKRLRFIINLEAANQNQIKIDSQLLALAIEVKKGIK